MYDRYFAGLEIELVDEIKILEVCKYMGNWDYHTYMKQPQWFIDAILLRIESESYALKKLQN